MSEFLCALEISTVEMGKYNGKLPLHCTVLPWVKVQDVSPSVVWESVKRTLKGVNPVKLQLVGRDLFGVHNDIHVGVLLRTDELQSLHERIKNALDTLGGKSCHPEWVGAGYRPHVTNLNGYDRFVISQPFVSRRIFLVHKQRGKNVTKMVIGHVNLIDNNSPQT